MGTDEFIQQISITYGSGERINQLLFQTNKPQVLIKGARSSRDTPEVLKFTSSDQPLAFWGTKGQAEVNSLGIISVDSACEPVSFVLESATPLDDIEDETCIVQPFCSRLKDCCDAHAECYSMCCSAKGSCIDSKYCYTDGIKGTVELKGGLTDQRLTQAVNSTTVPYYSTDESSVSPCF